MDESGDPAEAADMAMGDVDTSSVSSRWAFWGDNVSITINDGWFSFVSDGLPNHELPDQFFLVPVEGNNPPFDGDNVEDEFEIAATDGLIVESPLDIDIAAEYSDEVTLTDLSTIGVMISGAPLFNDYEDMNREFIAVDDNISLDGVLHQLATATRSLAATAVTTTVSLTASPTWLMSTTPTRS